MGHEYRAKAFKSGNSVALRLPKALGIAEGTELMVRQHDGGLTVTPFETPKRRIDVSGFWGKASGLRVLSSQEREFEERPSAQAASDLSSGS